MKASCLSVTFSLLHRNLNNWYHLYSGEGGGGGVHGKHLWEQFFVVFIGLTTIGDFWSFDGWEIEQVQRKEESWSFCDNIIINAPLSCHHEKLFTIKKIKCFSICSKPSWFFWLIHQLLVSTPTLCLIQYHLE